MAEKSDLEKRSGLSGKHYFILALVGTIIILVIGMVFLQAEEEGEEPAVCGEDCHEENYMGYNEPQANSFMNAHLENELECWDCHLGAEIEDKSDVPHGEVNPEKCLIGCHGKVDWQIEAPKNEGDLQPSNDKENRIELIWHPNTDNGTSIGVLKKLDSCIDCHDPRANSMGLGAQTCPICHDISQEELEVHGEDTCSITSCHSETPDMRIDKTGHLEVEGHCSLCHDSAHTDDVFVPYEIEVDNVSFTVEPAFCISCHNETANELISIGGPHEVDMCLECHSEHKNSVDCTTCHSKSQISHPSDDSYGECQDCHVKGGHNPEQLDFPTSKSQVLSESFCGSTSCHEQDVYDVIGNELGGKLHGEEDFDEDCIQCHTTHSDEVLCFSCHDKEKEPDHDILEPFDDCSRCHVSGHDKYNITFSNFNETDLTSSFCEDCHEGVSQEIMIEGPEHTEIACQKCHEDARGKAISCNRCHISGGEADPPGHSVEGTLGYCSNCHDTAHDPKEISSFDVTFSNNDFCASCHSEEPLNQYSIFSEFGEGHKTEVITCTPSCHTDHTARMICTTEQCHSGTSYPPKHAQYLSTECLDCHESAHDPTNSAPRPGSSLSQKGYMENHYEHDTLRLKNTFSWPIRGNHTLGNSCDQCHDSPVSAKYPNSSLLLINSTGSDCSLGCHNWIDPNTTTDPFVLIDSTTSKHNSEIFNNASRGGCGGYCHQEDPDQPDLNGSQHGVITDCLDAQCHESQFSGGNLSQGHRDHEQGLEDAQVDCFTVCHTDIDGDHSDCLGCHSHYAKYGKVPASEKLIAGGCYGCHKSGHDPGLLPDNPCKDCH